MYMQAMDMFNMADGHTSLLEGVGRVKSPVLVLGVTSDVLFPVEQQREMAALLQKSGRCDSNRRDMMVGVAKIGGIYGGCG